MAVTLADIERERQRLALSMPPTGVPRVEPPAPSAPIGYPIDMVPPEPVQPEMPGIPYPVQQLPPAPTGDADRGIGGPYTVAGTPSLPPNDGNDVGPMTSIPNPYEGTLPPVLGPGVLTQEQPYMRDPLSPNGGRGGGGLRPDMTPNLPALAQPSFPTAYQNVPVVGGLTNLVTNASSLMSGASAENGYDPGVLGAVPSGAIVAPVQAFQQLGKLETPARMGFEMAGGTVAEGARAVGQAGLEATGRVMKGVSDTAQAAAESEAGSYIGTATARGFMEGMGRGDQLAGAGAAMTSKGKLPTDSSWFHGTKRQFDTFDITQGHPGNEHGQAIYVASKASESESYGTVRPVTVSGKLLDGEAKPNKSIMQAVLKQALNDGAPPLQAVAAYERALRAQDNWYGFQEFRPLLKNGRDSVNDVLRSLGYVGETYIEDSGVKSAAIFDNSAVKWADNINRTVAPNAQTLRTTRGQSPFSGNKRLTPEVVDAEIKRVGDSLDAMKTAMGEQFSAEDEARYIDQLMRLYDVKENLGTGDLNAAENMFAAEMRTQLEGLKASVEGSPYRPYVNLVAKSGNMKGSVPDSFTAAQYRKLTGKDPLALRPDGRVDVVAMLDELAAANGTNADGVKAGIEGVWRDLRDMAAIQRNLKGMSMPDVPVEPPVGGGRIPSDMGIERGFANTLRTSETTAPEVRAALEAVPETYPARRNTAEAFAAAQERVAADPSAAQTRLLQQATTKAWSDADTFEAQALLKHLQDTGQYEGEVALGRQLAASLTEAGRTVQAASVWSRLSPEGIRQATQNVIDDAAKGNLKGTQRMVNKALSNVVGEQAAADRDVAEGLLVKLMQKAKQAAKLPASATAEDMVNHLADLQALVADSADLIKRHAKAVADVAKTDARVQKLGWTEEELPGVIDAMRTRAAVINGELKAFDRSRQAMVDAEAQALHLQRGIEAGVFDSVPEMAGRKAEAQAMLRDYNRLRQGMVNAEAKEMQLIERVGSGQAESADQIAQRTRDALDFVQGYNRARQQMVNAEAEQIQLLNRVASGQAETAEQLAERTAKAREFTNAYNRTVKSADSAEKKLAALQSLIDSGQLPSLVEQQAREVVAQTELQMLRQDVKNLQWFTDLTARETKKAVQSEYSMAVAKAKNALRGTDVTLPQEVAQVFVQNARKLQTLPEGSPERYILSKNIMADVAQFVPQGKWDAVLDVLGISRTVKTMWDFSAPFRQGVVLAAGHPGDFARAFVPMFKAAKSDEYAMGVDAVLHTRPLAETADKAGLYLAPLDYGGTGSITKREEAYVSRIARHIPGAAASERAYVTFLNKLRADVFDGWVTAMESRGVQLSDRDLADYAQFVNWATGRGSLPKSFDGVSNALSQVLFSPRFAASRLELPVAGAKALVSEIPGARKLFGENIYSSPVAKQIGHDLGMFMMAGIGTLGLFNAAKLFTNDVNVETDPRSTDFGRGKVGNQRVDIWGGEQQIARLMAQYITGQKKTSSGKITEADRNELLGTFARTKLSPNAGLLNDLRLNENFQGREMVGPGSKVLPASFDPKEISESLAWNTYAPLVLADALDAYRHGGLLAAAAAGGGSAFGIGVQTYQTTRDLQNEQARQVYGKDYTQLDRAEQRAVNETPQLVASREDYKRREQMTNAERVRYGLDTYEKVKAGAEEKFAGEYPQMLTGEARRNYIKAFKDEVRKAADTVLRGLNFEEVPPASARDAYAQAYWSIEAPLDPLTGEPDFKAQRAERNKVAADAVLHDVDPKYITERGKESYLDLVAKRPEVRKALEEYDRDMKYLQPYFELKDKTLGAYPELRAAQSEADDARRAGDTMKAMYIQNRIDDIVGKVRRQYLADNRLAAVTLVKWGMGGMTAQKVAAQ